MSGQCHSDCDSNWLANSRLSLRHLSIRPRLAGPRAAAETLLSWCSSALVPLVAGARPARLRTLNYTEPRPQWSRHGMVRLARLHHSLHLLQNFAPSSFAPLSYGPPRRAASAEYELVVGRIR